MSDTLTQTTMLSLGEELLLLALDDERGTVHGSAAMAMPYALAGALLLELTLAGRLAAEDTALIVRDQTPTGDDLLDAALAVIAGATRTGDARYWVGRLDRAVPHLKERLLDQLIVRGILRYDEHRVLGIIPRAHYPVVDFTTEWEMRHRVRAVILDGETPDARTAILLSLVQACQLTDTLFTRDERARARRRLKEIAQGELVGKAIADTVAGMEAAVTVAVIAATSASVAACATGSASC